MDPLLQFAVDLESLRNDGSVVAVRSLDTLEAWECRRNGIQRKSRWRGKISWLDDMRGPERRAD